MKDDWVIVADGAQARFMVFTWHDGPSRGALRFIETSQLDNPECTISGRRDARKIKSGYDNTSYRFTDHREQHDDELHRRFSLRIASQAQTLVTRGDVSAIILVANSRMMNLLLPALKDLAKSGISISTLQRDYTWCTTPQIQQHLSENGLTPMHYEIRLSEALTAPHQTSLF